MDSTKRDWTLSLLWTNLAVAVVVLVLLLGNQISSVRQLLNILGYALVYANLVMLLGLLLIGRITQRLALSKLPLVPAVAACIIGVVPVGCLLVQALLMAIGVVVPQHFWREYLATLRVSVPLATVFGLGAFLHASLRNRLQVTEQALREKELAEERAKKLAAEARLRSLESRIQPHFLFNTLNSISSLITVDPVRAEQIVGRLAALLRASLDTSDRSLIPLGEELAMTESYIAIEKVRFGDKLCGSINVPATLQEVKVPPMSVQALVENAVKHGITPKVGGGEVCVAASAEDANLRIEVRDSGFGFDLSVVPPGHGLDNLIERLNALFGDKARLNAFRRDGHSVVEMVLPRV